ncbi:NAD(P)H-dependent flavin oxidoreductase [Streptomyces sp. NPDC004012]
MHTRLTDRFNLAVPIVLAPMDLVADARLARAVTESGGLGLLGGGYGNRAWLQREFERAADADVGCGFITWSMAQRPGLLEFVLEQRPAAVFLSFGDPRPFADRIRAAGVPLMCQASNRAQAEQALEAGADVLIAQGGEAGGHGLGIRSTFTLVPEVADLVRDQSPDTLILAAGGIVDGRGLAAALALGADGVVVGSRLWAAEEAAVDPRAQARGIAASADDTVRTSIYDIVRRKAWPQEYNGRLLRNDFVDRWHGNEDDLRRHLATAEAAFSKAVEDGDFDVANMIVGEGIGLVRNVLPTATITEQMMDEASGVLRRLVAVEGR